MKKKGIIYLMSSAIDGVFKIGISETKNFPERMRNLEKNGYSNITGLKKEIAIETENYDEKEKLLHNIFSKSRISDTEFFAGDLKIFEQLFYSLKGEIVFPKNINSEDEIEEISREIEEKNELDITSAKFVEFVKKNHFKNPGILKNLLARNSEFKPEKTKIYVLNEEKISEKGTVLSKKIDENIHIYVNYSKKDLTRAICDYEKLFLGKVK